MSDAAPEGHPDDADPVAVPAPWAPLPDDPPEEPAGDAGPTAPTGRSGPTGEVPPPPPLSMPSHEEASDPPWVEMPDLHHMLGPAPIGQDGFPIYGPGSLPPIRRRGWARTIDTLLIAIPGLVVMAIFLTNVAPDNTVTVEEVPLWALGVLRVVDFVYQTIAVALPGSTVGKAIMGLRVEDPVGAKPGLSAAALRELLPDMISMVPFIGGALAIIGYLTAERLPLRQHFYDRAAGTIVVSTR